MKSVLFDLDDTLYPEMQFVESGFWFLAKWLSERHRALAAPEVLAELLDILRREGRGTVFDTFLQAHDLFTESRVKTMLYLYRSHPPKIALYPEVVPLVRSLRARGLRLGLITDGMASVQRNKISALDLAGFVDLVLCTDELGKDCWKPSIAPFKVALEMFETDAADAMYVGDDISKDFLGPNKIGMVTVQLVRPSVAVPHLHDLPVTFKPRHLVSNLNDIVSFLGDNPHA